VKHDREEFRTTALREAREECRIIGADFPGINQLISPGKMKFGMYNWETYGYMIDNSEADILSKSFEFDELKWFRTDKLPTPIFQAWNIRF